VAALDDAQVIPPIGEVRHRDQRRRHRGRGLPRRDVRHPPL